MASGKYPDSFHEYSYPSGAGGTPSDPSIGEKFTGVLLASATTDVDSIIVADVVAVEYWVALSGDGNRHVSMIQSMLEVTSSKSSMFREQGYAFSFIPEFDVTAGVYTFRIVNNESFDLSYVLIKRFL
jgi:hypothetical protein